MSAYFVTLTYDNSHLVRTKRGFMTLDRPAAYLQDDKMVRPLSHVQKFIRRLRFEQFGRLRSNLKYYLCGEYGTHNWRPHYHVLFFNVELKYLIGVSDAKMVELRTLDIDGKVPYYCRSWSDPDTGEPYGHITVGRVSADSVGYVLKYMQKPHRIPLHRNDDRVPEFSFMSKGLGRNYLSSSMIRWHKADLLNRMYIPHSLDCKIAMPRYYKLKLYTDDERRDILRYLETIRKPVSSLRECDRIFYNNMKLKNASTKNRNL